MDAQNFDNKPTPADALDTVATEHVLARLKEAVALAERGLADRAERVADLLRAAVDQIDAWELSRAASGGSSAARPISLLRCTALAHAAGEPLSEFLLIPFGEVRVERPVSGGSFVFTRDHAESARQWFDRIGRKLAIDYEHQSFERLNTRPDGLRPAAGWIGGLAVRDDGLWAVDVSWTDRAQQLLRAGEYRYFSPVIFWTDADQTDVAALGPVALTNDPAMRGVQALTAASRALDEAAAGDGETTGQDGGDKAPPTEAACLQRELEAAEEEVELLRRQLRAQEADTFVERGMRLGKIVDSTSVDWRDDFLRDPEATEARLQRAPVILPPGRLMRLDARGSVIDAAGARGEFARHAERYRRLGVDAKDLEAYEHAVAAGHVRHYGALR